MNPESQERISEGPTYYYEYVAASGITISQKADFDIYQVYGFMQRGLMIYKDQQKKITYPYSDFIYVNGKPQDLLRQLIKTQKLESNLLAQLSQALNYKLGGKIYPQEIIPIPQQMGIVSFSFPLWESLKIFLQVRKDQKINNLSLQDQQFYKQVQARYKEKINNKHISQHPIAFYKENIQLLVQVKKKETNKDKPINQLSSKIVIILKKYFPDQTAEILEGDSKSYCGTSHAIMGGRFNDNMEVPKDPYTMVNQALIGYENPQSLGGSYLLAQRLKLEWPLIHNSNQSLSETIGRNTINDGSNIFSQNHCPYSHIRKSRVKDEFGNPRTLYRQSKSYTTSGFDINKNKGYTDNILPQEGIFFIGYSNKVGVIEDMIKSQLGITDFSQYKVKQYADNLLNFFQPIDGGLLYTPNIKELANLYLQFTILDQELKRQCGENQSICAFDSAKLQGYTNTGNPYYIYDSQGYLIYMGSTFPPKKPRPQQRMERRDSPNQAKTKAEKLYYENIQQWRNLNLKLGVPSPQVLRLISKTFALWQDTWYFNRKQQQFKSLKDYLNTQNIRSSIKIHVQNSTNIDVSSYLDNVANYQDSGVSVVIRNGLAIHVGLGYVLSTLKYGRRGPIDPSNPTGPFGSATFHLEPEDILAGGQANLTFGQGKHLIPYLSQNQRDKFWSAGISLSEHSGIGHIVAYLQDIMQNGLQYLIDKYVGRYNAIQGQSQQDMKKKEMFLGTILALTGLQKYFVNYSQYADQLSKSFGPSQPFSKSNLQAIKQMMKNLSTEKPTTLRQGAQLVLTIFIALHITGEPVSLGRLDKALQKFVKDPKDPQGKLPTVQQQSIFNCMWIKIGQKANFNKSFFQDHQKWGNLAMGGMSSPYPQGASFNQWGHQLTVGGSAKDENNNDVLDYNNVTIYSLIAARTIPTNAPCLGIRIHQNMPQIYASLSTQAILAGGAHPILLNQKKIVAGLKQCGSIYKQQFRKAWAQEGQQKKIDVPYDYWKGEINDNHLYDYTSDGCYQYHIVGRSWFWLAGGCVLQPLQYLLNEGKDLLNSGPRFIYGKRVFYKDYQISNLQPTIHGDKTYTDFQNKYFEYFKDIMSQRFRMQLENFGTISDVCPATLLNAFTATQIDRQSDFYQNGAQYKLFCPQFTGIANLVNSLWNIKTFVYEQKLLTLQQVRQILLVNWGKQLGQPFVTINLPQFKQKRIIQKCQTIRRQCWNQPKFGIDKTVTDFGNKIAGKLSKIACQIFSNPDAQMIKLLKTLTLKYGTKTYPFGIQVLPGCGTFQNYLDAGSDCGASFDGRLKGMTVAQDYSPQPLHTDWEVNEQEKKISFQQILTNYSYTLDQDNDPRLYSGSVVDFNIDNPDPDPINNPKLKSQGYNEQALLENIKLFQKGQGPNLITITCCDRKLMQQARKDTQKNLLRFRMGGWTQFGIAMYKDLLEQHIRRVRASVKPVLPVKAQQIKKRSSPSFKPQDVKEVQQVQGIKTTKKIKKA